jgi:scyllo-inositol 2-dehydrogenase (NADP+)
MSQPPVRAAILSYGMSGEVFHAPLLSALREFELAVIVQRSSDKAKEHYPHIRVERSVDDVFTDDSIDLVIVNTPNSTHFEFTRRALESGKHVVVEKPFTVTSAEADKLISIASENRRHLTVFQNRRWDSDFLTVQKVLAEGRLGRVVEFEAHYDRFRNYVESNTWKEEVQPGTGILYNLGSHMLDQVRLLFGMPSSVDARVGVQRPGGRVDDFYDIRLQYDGLLAIVKSSYLVKASMPRYIIHGMQGSFVKFGIDPQEQALKEKVSPATPSWGEEPAAMFGKLDTVDGEERVPSLKGDYTAFYRNLYQVIRSNAALKVKPEEARDVIRIIEACYESNRTKRAVQIN